jgi:hypothetical protein
LIDPTLDSVVVAAVSTGLDVSVVDADRRRAEEALASGVLVVGDATQTI